MNAGALPGKIHGRMAILLSTILVGLVCTVAQAQQFYRLESAVVLRSSTPEWDYVAFEPARAYLFIGRRGDGVTVYDTAARKIVGTIENSQDANATTLVSDFDLGYTVNEDGSTTMFQLSSLKTLKRIKFGDDADNAFYEPATRQIAFMMGDSQQIAFLDARTGSVVGRLKMDSHKLDGAAPDGEGNLFVAQRDRNSVARVDARQHKVTAEWTIAGCEEPTGLAFDSDHKRIFVGCRGKKPVLAVLDSESGKLVAAPEIGHGNDGVVYDPETHQVYTSNGVDANLVIYNQVTPDVYQLAEAATTRPYARTMALDPKSKKVYTVTAEGTVDPARKVNRGPAAFYPNTYFPDTFTLLTYSRR